jgi:glyoxylase-like metal-dependent hydrolase (beta-lactamase superfamily II)
MTIQLPRGLQVIERGWLSSNVVVAKGKHPAIIDSGYFSHSAQTVSIVETAFGQSPPELLVNTHLHSDHCGGNSALQSRYTNLRTFIPPGLARHVMPWNPAGLSYEPTGQTCPAFVFDDLLRPGEEILLGDLSWEIHAAPGHDPDSIVLFERQSSTLLSADALWENGFGVVFPELEGVDAFGEVARTLDLIEQLRPSTVIPGHGKIFTFSPEVMARARQRLDAFVGNPVRHANHAAKVLLKFKLLELQKVATEQLAQWVADTTYFELMRTRFFPSTAMNDWIGQLLAELEKSQAIRITGCYIENT